MMRIALVHYLPLSYYPPAVNLLQDMQKETDFEVIVYTRRAKFTEKEFEIPSVKLKYLGDEIVSSYGWYNTLLFLWFHVKVFILMLIYRPQVIFYYENLSSICVAAYKYFFEKVKVLAHYHEYFDPVGNKGLPLSQRFCFYIERKYLYHKLQWLSHTNSARLDMFRKDHGIEIDPIRHGVLPNYPPVEWLNRDERISRTGRIKLIYIGSLSSSDFYLRELFEWTLINRDKVELTLFSYYIKPDVFELLNEFESDNITLNAKGIYYFDIPEILKQHDVGLVLYKPLNLNMQFNETNKLFEYLICGLDVIYPKEMSMISAHNSSFPGRLFAVDFKNMDKLSLEALDKSRYSNKIYPCEFVKEKSSQRLINSIRRAGNS